MPPAGTHELSPSKRGAICQLRKDGYSFRGISEKTGVPLSTVHYTVKRDETFHTRHSLPRSGRPPAVSSRTKRRVIREVIKDRRAPWKAIAEAVGDITEQQVRKIATSAGYHRRVARRKPFLSKATIQKRRAWAQANLNTDWTTIIWTDETTLVLGERLGQEHVTRMPGEEFLPENIQPTFRSGRRTIMVWGAVALGRKGPLVRLEPGDGLEKERKGGRQSKGKGGLNAERYVSQILEGPLFEFYTTLNKERGGRMLVVEDGAPAHASQATETARKCLGIHTLSHPPNSPNLNPIEPLWNLLKRGIAQRPVSHKSLDTLWEAAQLVWAELSEVEMTKAMGNMVARVKAVRAAKGGHTPF